MKKIFFIAVGLLLFMSCNKDYTCECKDDNNATSFKFLNTSKNKAETDCDLLNVDFTVNGGGCTLK